MMFKGPIDFASRSRVVAHGLTVYVADRDDGLLSITRADMNASSPTYRREIDPTAAQMRELQRWGYAPWKGPRISW